MVSSLPDSVVADADISSSFSIETSAVGNKPVVTAITTDGAGDANGIKISHCCTNVGADCVPVPVIFLIVKNLKSYNVNFRFVNFGKFKQQGCVSAV